MIYIFKEKKKIEYYNLMYPLEIKTICGNAIRLLVESLKDILQDVNLIITKEGIKIICMDSSHTVLIYLKLEADKFEVFHIEEESFVLGINMSQLFKLIRTIGNNDTLTFFLQKDNMCDLGIKIEDSNKNSLTIYTLKLLDLNNESYDIPPTTFKSIITLPTHLFQKYIRDMNNLAELIEIKSFSNQLIFTIQGEFCKQETVLGETNGGMQFHLSSNDKRDNENLLLNIDNSSKKKEIIQGIFSLKHLVQFTKCTGLCQQMKIFLKNNYPIICEYKVASLGFIQLCLAPKVVA